MSASLTPLPTHPARRPVVPSSVLGTLVFITAETMFFIGMISAFTISKAGAPPGTWPAFGQPTLPVESTAFNTLALLVSGLLLAIAQWQEERRHPSAKGLLVASWVLGVAFVALQGREWVALLSQGLTLTSSRLGAFFYLIVGTHALHAVGALLVLGLAMVQRLRDRLERGLFLGAQTFWYFVVLLWPFLYARVYF